MEIAYAAHTESCTFMLDANGVCRWVVATNASPQPQSRQWEKSQQAAARCVGAQYVASLDVHTRGGLLEMPRVGVPMLFARVDPDTGRVTLVRTAAITVFETRGEQPATVRDDWDSGMRQRPTADEVEDEDDDLWEIDTRRMRREEVWHDVDPDPESGEEWDVETATAKVQMHPATLDRMRPPSNGGSQSREVYATAPPTRHASSYAMPIPKPAPLPRAHTLPPAPTNKRPTIPPPRVQYNHARPQHTPLPPPPGYAPPRTPPPMPPPRRPMSDETLTPARRVTYSAYGNGTYGSGYAYEEPPPPRQSGYAPAPPSWNDQRPTIRRAR